VTYPYVIQNLLLTSAVKVAVHCSMCPMFQKRPRWPMLYFLRAKCNMRKCNFAIKIIYEISCHFTCHWSPQTLEFHNTCLIFLALLVSSTAASTAATHSIHNGVCARCQVTLSWTVVFSDTLHRKGFKTHKSSQHSRYAFSWRN